MRMSMMRTTVAAEESEQAQGELSGCMWQHISGHVGLVIGKHLDMHANMLWVDLHHDVLMLVLGLTGFAQVEIITHSALEARTMEKVANVTAITDNAAVTQATWTVGSSKTATSTRATIFVDYHHDASGHLVGAVDLDHGVGGLGTGFTGGTQVVIITNRAFEAGPGQRGRIASITHDASMSDDSKGGRGNLCGSGGG